jgi:DNA-binding MarR family transcriptional regulator
MNAPPIRPFWPAPERKVSQPLSEDQLREAMLQEAMKRPTEKHIEAILSDVLELIAAGDGVIMRDIAARLEIDRQDASKYLKKLKDRGLIWCGPRKKHVEAGCWHMTDKGKEKLENDAHLE